MSYENLLSGSPLIPYRIIISYLLANITILICAYFWQKKQFLKIFFRSLFLFNFFISAVLTAGGLYLFTPEPGIISGANDKDTIEISFNRPVKRKELNKTISPYIPGIWIYEDPIYDTHLYKKLVFYPDSRLIPGIEYTIKLSGVRNFLNSKSSSLVYNFRTHDVFDVLGVTETESKFKVLGSFPQNGWDGINIDTPVKIRFSHGVDKTSAEDNFSISPEVDGLFSWEGETMIFTPSENLKFATGYTIVEKQGVKILNGSFLTQAYSVRFTTQPESTKLNAPSFLQKYTLSCEIAALRMALSYRGVNVEEDELLKLVGFDPNGKKGNNWGNPYVGFVGNVKGKQMVNGYGVYWDPIARAANNYRYSKSFENWNVKNLTESIQKSTPVIVWISIKGQTPTLWTTPTGDQIKAVPDEHAVLVTGFTGSPNNPTQIIVNDPLIGEAYWPRASFEKKWISLGNSGVVVF